MESTEDLVRRHGDYLRRLALALVHDEATARDVEQETWRVALERRDARVERPREWLGGIARHVAWRRSREESRRAARERDVARPEGTEGSASLEWGDTLQAALRRLDEPHREAVVQRYLMDRPPREIARRTGVPLETVKSRLKRGLAAMRADLDRQHGGDRRAWAVGLAGAFDLSLEVPATGLVSRGAQPVPATSVPWITSLTMYAKLLASIAVVASVSVWAFDGFERSSPSKGDTILEAPLGDATPTPLARIDEIPPGREAGLQPERDSSFTAGDGEFALAMEFETRSLFGDPLPGVSVHVAPPNHPFVTVGTTDSEGRVEIRWPSRLPAMTVDVAFDLDGDDLAGVQRVTVSEGVVRRVVAQVDRRSVNDHAHRLVEGEARVAEEEPQRSAPQRGGARRYARRDIGFSTEPEIGILLSVPIIRGALVGLDVVAFDEFDDVTNDEPAQSSFIEGMIVDELGQPLPSYPVRFTTGDGPASAHVLTDDEGSYRIEVAAESARVFVGAGDSQVEWSTPLEPGQRVSWSPSVVRKRDLMLEMSDDQGHDLDGAIVQVRHDDGETLWIGRAAATKAGSATVYGCPVERVQVTVLTKEKFLALPLLSLDSVPTGRAWPVAIGYDELTYPPIVRWTPEDAARTSAPATELIVLDESKSWGQRVRVPGPLGSSVELRVPTGTWWFEVATRATGRTEIGTVSVLGSEPIDLGPIALTPTGELALSGDGAATTNITIDWIREDVDSRVATRTGDEPPKVLTLAPGLYRMTTTGADGSSSSSEIEVVANEAVSAR